MPMKIHAFWYEKGVLGLRFEISGQAVFHYNLAIPEMNKVLAELKYHGHDSEGNRIEMNHNKGNTAWWAYECIVDENKERYLLGDEYVANVPLCLYLNDYFHVYLPHDVGVKMIDIIESRLNDMAQCEALPDQVYQMDGSDNQIKTANSTL